MYSILDHPSTTNLIVLHFLNLILNLHAKRFSVHSTIQEQNKVLEVMRECKSNRCNIVTSYVLVHTYPACTWKGYFTYASCFLMKCLSFEFVKFSNAKAFKAHFSRRQSVDVNSIKYQCWYSYVSRYISVRSKQQSFCWPFFNLCRRIFFYFDVAWKKYFQLWMKFLLRKLLLLSLICVGICYLCKRILFIKRNSFLYQTWFH